MLLTWHLVTLPVVISITSLVIKVLHLMTLDCSTVLTFPFRWFAPLERTPSNPRLVSRRATASSQTHSQKEPLKVLDASASTATATIVALPSRTSCDHGSHISWRPSGLLFLCLLINNQKGYGNES